MKKRITVVLCLLLALLFVGCGIKIENEAGVDPSETEPRVVFTSDGKAIQPLLHLIYSELWSDIGFISADNEPASEQMVQWPKTQKLLELNYSKDLSVSCSDGVELRDILVYDESMNQQERFTDLAELANLEPGKYYIGITINQDGKYIEEAGQSECHGYACMFIMTVE